MKKYIIILSSILFTTTISAQNRFDALRYSQQFYEGSARSIAMGNAFTSLGGDLGVLSINPASSAVYRYSEFQFTPSLTNSGSESLYLGNSSTESFSKFGVSSLGYVSYFNTPRRNAKLLNINFSFAINKLNNFNSRFAASGRTSGSSWLSSVAENTNGIQSGELDIQSVGDTYPYYNSGASWRGILAWNSNLLDLLPDSNNEYIAASENISGNSIVIGGNLDQDYFRETTGGLSEFIINMGANFSNKFFFGASIGIQTLQYSDYQKYSETAVNPLNFDVGFKDFSHVYRQNTSGAGINLKLGMIYTPVKGLRLGASIATPTVLSLTDEWDESITSNFNDGYKQSILSPLGQFKYMVTSPLRFNLGVSFVLGNWGAISGDYEGADYSSITMGNVDQNTDTSFKTENDRISSDFGLANNLRLGLELRPVSSLALRAGYAYYQNPEKAIGNDNQYLSIGAGIRSQKGIFADLGIQKRITQSEGFSLYDDVTNHPAPVGTSDYSGWKVLVTVGFRF